MEQQELLQRAVVLKEQSEETEKQLDFVVQQIRELDEFGRLLEELEKSEGREMLAPLGKGVYAKTERKAKDFFVKVGAGVVVRKTPKEVRETIRDQLKRFMDARIQLTAQLEMFKGEFGQMLKQVERLRKG